MMQFLKISLFLFLFSSCSLKTTEGLRTTLVSKTQVENLYFSDHAQDYIYKAKIDIYGRYFGGILIIKKLKKNTHRVVFTTEFGSKVFDFLYEGDTFTKNFIVPDIDKKFIVNTLQKDFKILISETAQVKEQFELEEIDVYKSEADKKFNFYFFNKENQRLEKIVNTSKSKEKVTILFTSKTENIAEKIAINHNNIKLSIDLDYFKKE
jgi:hypothetical protein